MKNKKILLALVVAGLIGVGYGLYMLGMRHAMAPASQSAAAATTDKKVLYWHDPMVPGQKFDKPGKSPFMDMELVPVYADQGADEGAVSISPRVQQNLGVRTAEVSRGSLGRTVEAVGNVAYNERDVALVAARSNGFVEKLFVRAPLDPVKKGQPLAELYVPDWVAAQEEYLAVKRMRGTDMAALVDGARQRMRLAGMSEAQIRQVDASGKVRSRVTVRSPIAGVVAELNVREGTTIMSGAPMFRINGLDTVWVNAELPESMAALVGPGTEVKASVPALPDTVLKGKVAAILPQVAEATRTLVARVELDNPGQRLVPGMFATLQFAPPERGEVLLVPSEAVIETGKRSVVMLAEGEGNFRPVDVETGLEAGGQTEIRKGLEAGQKVVVSGQFLIDSEASLRGTATRMAPMPAPMPTPPDAPPPAAGAVHRSVGKVEAIDGQDITLSHEPVPSLKWPAMTMGFEAPDSGVPQGLQVGDTVRFEFIDAGDGVYKLTSITENAP